jgi:riboflavin transporter FmnP
VAAVVVFVVVIDAVAFVFLVGVLAFKILPNIKFLNSESVLKENS